jgi:O-antigen ligase
VFNVDQVTRPFLYYLVIGLIYFMAYLFFLQTIEGDYLKYIIRLFVVLGFLVSLQVLIYYAQSGDILIALESDRVHLGWGISNSVATYLIVFISITLYYVKTKPWFLLSTLLISFEIIMLLFTLSRAGVLSFVALLPFGLFYLYYKQKNKLTITLYLMILVIILSTIFVIKSDYFMPLYERFKDLKFSDGNGRVAIWKEGIQTFVDYPIFGKGIFARVDGDYFGFYHNTFIHTLASLGTIGLISLLWQIIAVICLFSKRLNLKTGVILLAFIGANIHGLFDNVYFMPQFMVIYLILVAILEAYDREEESYHFIWRPPYVKR